MAEAGRGRRFAMEPLDEDRMNGIPQDLEGHRPLELRVRRLVDDAGAAAADLREDVVLPEPPGKALVRAGFAPARPDEVLQPVDRVGAHRDRMNRTSSSTFSPGPR